jgi:hypothetical protein
MEGVLGMDPEMQRLRQFLRVPAAVKLPSPRWIAIYWIVVMVFIFFVFPARGHAAEWPPVARQCVEEIEAKGGCTSACVNRLWTEVVRCTNDRLRRRCPEDTLAAAIHRIEKARAPGTAELVGDPVKEVFQKCFGE